MTMPSTSRHNPPYNIIPIHDHSSNHPSLHHPEVHAAQYALYNTDDLRKPPSCQWQPHYDLLDWLGLFFGFQSDNIKNQREHIVLHLANSQMRLRPLPENMGHIDHNILRCFRRKLLENYTLWCTYLRLESNVHISEDRIWADDFRRELLYVGLYLLIWGEAANLRFVPECLCYIFHHMALELNKILLNNIDENTRMPYVPKVTGKNAFLDRIVKPIYDTISKEVGNSCNGTKSHSSWRNYDDVNEYFWSRRCIDKLGWPIDLESTFFVVQGRKRGFVEQRSFWNLFRSFDRLWVMLVLFLQVAIIVAWDQEINRRTYPWSSLRSRDVQVKCLSLFLTWSAMRLVLSFLHIWMQHRLISKETLMVGVRMLLKCLIAAFWVIVFGTLYARIWMHKNLDKRWSVDAERQVKIFLLAVVVFVFPQVLALVLLIFPCVQNFVEKTDRRMIYFVTWWFQTRMFIGRGLFEGIADSAKYILFWIVVLGTKFVFSYFLQIKPMMRTTNILLNLRGIHHEWYEFFKGSSQFAVGLMWLPVVLMYLMDLQIWYSIWSSIVGVAVGWFSHMGKIRNMQQLRLRFEFFAIAILSLMAAQSLRINKKDLSKNRGRRRRLRSGYGNPFEKLESSPGAVIKFAWIWNEMIRIFREEDIISDTEVELLELSYKNRNVIRVISWPCILLCNELLLALGQVEEMVDAPDSSIWQKICKYKYRRCAVIEAYDCTKYMLRKIIKHTEEPDIIEVMFKNIEEAIKMKRFTKTYALSALRKTYEKLCALVKLLIQPKKDDLSKVVYAMQALYETMIRDFYLVREAGLAPRSASGRSLLFQNAIELPDESDFSFYRQLRRLHTILTSEDTMSNVPSNLEARRRIAFFSNSLFMNMPPAPQVKKMLSFSVLTPYYNEEVTYSKEQLQKETEDGVSTLFYLRTIYKDEWENFMERMRREGMTSDREVWDSKLGELRLWASYRGQTLARTVRGMMYNYRALKMLAFLESASQMEIEQGEFDRIKATNVSESDDRRIYWKEVSSRNGASSSISQLFKGNEDEIVSMKYTYVIACQTYGAQKAEKQPQAEEMLQLLKHNEALRVAYVDEVSIGRNEKEYYSVLVKYDRVLEKEVDIYRIKLPGPIKLGEGKPENQNNAIMFTRGDAVQTIDMNQDNYFEEALKVRILLEEFERSRKPSILGIREHIFTSGVSSIARFMSAQEMSFVTLGQRVLANPLRVRMHYGHPDVFDRFWFLTRGGVSKASKVINISEDIFAGFNCTLRGGNVTHHEYIQVGKGREVGLNQISLFEAKVASGNGEQALSRDVYRLGHRLDFFRMLSFFYTTVGFYFNTMMVVLTIYAFLWCRLYMALSGIEASVEADARNNNTAHHTILNQQFIIQMGLFTALPMVVENSLELGFLNAIWDFIIMQLQLSFVFYTFSLGTKTHYFGRTILHGGAKYRATGRGFVVQHKSFTENYCLYSRSHFVKAIELGLILTVYAVFSPAAKDTFLYIGLTISSWFLVISWLLAPFVFNPFGFDKQKIMDDFRGFVKWIWNSDKLCAKSEQSWEQSWEVWWEKEQGHLRTTGLWGKLLEVILDLRFFFFQYGVVYHLGITAGNRTIFVYLLSWIYILVAIAIVVIISYAAKKRIYFLVIILITLVIVVTVVLIIFTRFKFVDFFTSLLAFVPAGWGLISTAIVFRGVLRNSVVWKVVLAIARLSDLMFGVIVLVPVALLSLIPGFQTLQTKILFNEAFSRGLRI